MRFSEDTIEQVRQAVDLVELIGGQVQLRKAGQAWKGLCPFHDERTPSFTVNPDRQAYHCFGCGAGGDAFRFVMETERLPFIDAVRALAERYGVTLPQAVRRRTRAGSCYRALDEAADVLSPRARGSGNRAGGAGVPGGARAVAAGSLEEFGVGLRAGGLGRAGVAARRPRSGSRRCSRPGS